MSTIPIPEVRTMVAAAKQFVGGEIHFSALVGPITECEWWARVHGAASVHRLASEWQLLVDCTWNEYGQHSNPLSVDELRAKIADDLASGTTLSAR